MAAWTQHVRPAYKNKTSRVALCVENMHGPGLINKNSVQSFGQYLLCECVRVLLDVRTKLLSCCCQGDTRQAPRTYLTEFPVVRDMLLLAKCSHVQPVLRPLAARNRSPASPALPLEARQGQLV